MQAAHKMVSQKLISIAKNLGHRVIASSVFRNKLPDAWQYDNDVFYEGTEPKIEKIEEDDDWIEYNLGFFYDGLKCGINLCVTILAYDKKVVEIKATYNGYVVYAEVEGEVKAYAPFPAWEDAMNMFYEAATAREKVNLKKEKEEEREKNKKLFSHFWQAFRMAWGY